MMTVARLSVVGLIAVCLVAASFTVVGGPSSETASWQTLSPSQLAAYVGGCNQCKSSDEPVKCDQCVKTATNNSKKWSTDYTGKACYNTGDAKSCAMTGTMHCGEGYFFHWISNEDCSGEYTSYDEETTEMDMDVASGDPC
jgi:hypothetical protein